MSTFRLDEHYATALLDMHPDDRALVRERCDELSRDETAAKPFWRIVAMMVLTAIDGIQEGIDPADTFAAFNALLDEAREENRRREDLVASATASGPPGRAAARGSVA